MHMPGNNHVITLKGSCISGSVSRFSRWFCVAALCLPTNAPAVDPAEYQWSKRLLFVVAPDGTDRAVRQVNSELEKHSKALDERDMLVYRLHGHGQSQAGDMPVSDAWAQKIRSGLGLQPDDRVLVLVGKDGGIKRRTGLSTNIHEIFRQIDNMPMRRAEMYERAHSGSAR
jgi:hypothetical protein